MAVSKEKRNIIHKWAAAGAATAAALPVGLDAAALFGEEVLMVIQIAAMFGHDISKETAKNALGAGALGCIAGTAVFEGLNIGYPFTIPAKVIAATAVMEALGIAAYELYARGETL